MVAPVPLIVGGLKLPETSSEVDDNELFKKIDGSRCDFRSNFMLPGSTLGEIGPLPVPPLGESITHTCCSKRYWNGVRTLISLTILGA